MTARTAAPALAGGVAFLLIATLNAGGYRYGASDQAFYIPAILKQLEPALFPRDASVFEPQARYFLVDEIVAGAIRRLGGDIASWFLAGQLVTLALLFAAVVALGRTVFRSPLAVVALVAAVTLRHRITKTGVNTLEGYFHPRMLVFALGVAALVLYLRGRPWTALLLVVASAVVHPSTAAFFLLLLGTATWVTESPARRPLAAVAVAALATAGAPMLWSAEWRLAFAPMDAGWRALLTTKDYLFPFDVWPAHAWVLNLGTATLALVGLHARARAGVAHPRERGLLAGAVALLSLFVLTLPAIARASALPIQLQIPRVFWLLELLALVPAIWWLVDRPAAFRAGRWVARGVCGVLVVGSLARGLWIGFYEQQGELFEPAMRSTDWTRALGWFATRARPDAHVLADPGHAWKYGYPVRSVGLDVYLEDTKDAAMALYSRATATRVIERMRDLDNFEALTPERTLALAAKYDLDYLITTSSLDLDLVAIEGRFRIYRLR